MLKANEFYEQLEQRFVTWAEMRDDIRAAFVVGSRARKDHPADESSDIDLVFYASNPEAYLSSSEWLQQFGELSTAFVSVTAGNDPEWLTLYEGGWEADFVIHSQKEFNDMVENKIIPGNFHRGVKVLQDKDKIASAILPDEFAAPKSSGVTEEQFLQAVNTFWFLALNVAKQIRRNDLWIAKARDSMLKEILLQMIEWHEKTIHGEDYDTWHAGRLLCEWADNDTVAALHSTFGHFDRDDSLSALKSTLILFQRLSHEVSQKKAFDYPIRLENTVMNWINQFI